MGGKGKALIFSFLFAALAVTLLLWSLDTPAMAYTVTVDGDGSDWVMTPTTQVNLGQIARDTAGQGEYTWTDNSGDERTSFASPDPNVDLLQFRITADRDNLYFTAAMSDIITATGRSAPQIRVAIDTDRQYQAGNQYLESTSTSVTHTAYWEYLLVTPFGSAGSPISQTLVYTDDAFDFFALTGTAAISDGGDVIEFSVPWSALGMSGPPTLPLRFTVGVCRADVDDNCLLTPTMGSRILDALTNYNDPGSTDNTVSETADSRLDYSFDLFFEADGDPYSPLLISEVLYDPSPGGTDTISEFIEIYNASPINIDLSGYKVGDEETIGGGEGMERFPGGTIPPGGVIVLAYNADSFVNTYGFLPDYAIQAGGQTVSTTSDYDTWATGSIALSNSGDEVILLDGANTAIDVVEYADSTPEWPGLANTDFGVNEGESMERVPADQDTNDIALDFSARGGDGDPGQVTLRADLAITKSVTPTWPAPGALVTYTLTFTNLGPGLAHDVLITDIIPLSITVNGFAAVGVVVTQTNEGTLTYTWQVQDLSSGTGGSIVITGVISSTLVPGDVVTNTAHITATAVDTDTPNNTGTAIFAIPIADLVITKTAAPDPVVAGEQLVYTITVINNGPDPIVAVSLSDTLHLSTTLAWADQTDDDNSASGFGGGTHEHTHWYDPRPGIGDDERVELSNPAANPTGTFTSRVMDGGNIGAWTTLEWVPRRPYWKPLPDNGGVEHDYDMGNVNMTGNRVLLHLDGPVGATIFTDTSGLDNDGACPAALGESCPIAGAEGRFNTALSFDGALSQTVVITDPVNPDRYAIELWVYPTVITDTALILRTNASSDTATYYSHLLGISGGRFIHLVNDGQVRIITSTTAVTVGRWYHLVGTAESGGDIKLYVNGVEEARLDGIGTLWSDGDQYRLGTAYAGRTGYFGGRIDEVAIYTRTLSAGEVHDHYLRGALRLYFQVRSCDDPACIGENFGSAVYSEQSNNSTARPALALNGVTDNRYFQYRALFESDVPAYSPQLRRVHVGPDHRQVVASQGQCLAEAQTFTCALGSLAASKAITVVAIVEVDPSALGIITNTALITTTPVDSDTLNNTGIVTNVVVSNVRLTIGKYDGWHGGSDPVNVGDVLTYTLEVHNYGPSTAWAVVVTDHPPISVTGVITPSGWSCTHTTTAVTCTTPYLRPGPWPDIVITGTAPITGGVVTNTGWITSLASTVYTTSHLSDTELTLIAPLADLVIAKAATPDPVEPGGTLTYTVVVTNAGPYTASEVLVTDTLPAGIVGTPYGDGWRCSSPGSEVTCALTAPLTVAHSATFYITLTAPLSGLIANRAVVTSAILDSNEGDNQVYAYAAVLPVADLSLTKRDHPDPVDAAAPLTYTILVTNAGPVPAGAMTTTLAPANSRYIHIPWGGQAAPYPSTLYLGSVPGLIRALTVTLHDLNHTYPADLIVLLVGPDDRSVVLMANAGGGVDVSGVTVTFNDTGVSLPISGAITSTLTYRPTNYGLAGQLPTPAPEEPYGGSLSTFYGRSPNGAWRLYVYDTVHSDGGSIAGGWSLQLVAVTTDTATLSDTLPSTAGATITPPEGWACQVTSETVGCETEYIAVNATATFTIAITAPITGGVITNTALITSTIADLEPDDNTTLITTTVTALADLAIVKVVTPGGQVPMSNPFTYTLTISNGGPSNVQSAVLITDLLPAQLSTATLSAPGWMCDTSAWPLISCTLSSGLAADAIAEITIVATAPLTSGLVLTNTAVVTSPVADPDPTNNTAQATFTVADLPITGLQAFNDSPTTLGNVTNLWATVGNGSNIVYTWAFGDGSMGSGRTVSHTYALTGEYTAVVTASNSVSLLTATTVVSITSVSGSRIYLPLIMRNYAIAPDLVVEQIVATSNSIQVVIANRGGAAVEREVNNEFWVDLYVNPSPAPTHVNQVWQDLCSQGLVWGVTVDALPLQPGDTLTLTVNDAYYRTDLSQLSWPLPVGTTIYAQVDSAHAQTSYGGVLENHEIVGGPYNNIAGPVLSTASVADQTGLPPETPRPLSSHLPPR